jgi:hypothetical protein
MRVPLVFLASVAFLVKDCVGVPFMLNGTTVDTFWDSNSTSHSLDKRWKHKVDNIRTWSNAHNNPIYIYRSYRGLFITFYMYGRYEVINPHGTWKSKEMLGERGERFLKLLRTRTLPTDFQFAVVPDPSKERGYEWTIRFNTLIAKDNVAWVEALAELETPFDFYSGHSPSYGMGGTTETGDWSLFPKPTKTRPLHTYADPCMGMIQFRNYDNCRKHYEHGCFMPWGECRTYQTVKLFKHPILGGTCTTCPSPTLWEFKKQLLALLEKTKEWPPEKDISRLRRKHKLDISDTYRLEKSLGIWRPENDDKLWDPTRPRYGWGLAQILTGSEHYYPFYKK